MIEYNLFRKNKLYQATIVALLMPLLVFVVSTITSYNLYQISVPWIYIAISALPLLGIFIKVKILTTDTSLVVSRHFFSILLSKKHYSKTENQAISWKQSQKNKKVFTLFVGETSTGISVNS